MRRYLEKAEWLNSIIQTVSNVLAERLGLIPVTGVAMAAVGFLLLLINVFVDHWALELPGVLLQGTGVLTSLIGLLLVEPFGK